MKTLSDLQAEQAAALAKLTAEHEIAAALPLIPDSVLLSSGKRAPWATFRKRTLSQALDVIGAFQIVPLYQFKGTFTELVPEGSADPKAEEVGGPYALALDVTCGDNFGPSVSIFFYSRLPDGRLVRINIDIEGPAYIGAFPAFAASRVPVKFGRRGEPLDWRIGPSQALKRYADSYVQWSTGDRKSAHHTYLFQADQAETLPAAEMTHALGQLRNLRDEFQPESGE